MPAIKAQELKLMYELEGAEWTCEHVSNALSDKHLKAEDFSIRDIAEAFIGREFVNACNPRHQSGGINILEAASDAVSSTAFSNITGQIVYSRMMDAWNSVAFVGDSLVETVPTEFETEKIPGVTRLGNNGEAIGEGEQYPTAGVTEEWIETPRTTKYGMIVPVTKEAIFYDRTGLVLKRASEVAEALRIRKERAILGVVTGTDTTITWKRNGGTGIAAYQASTPFVNIKASNGLADWTNIEAAELLFDAMTDLNTGEPIIPMAKQLLVPTALKMTARRIVNATEIRYGNTGSATGTQTIAANPVAGDYEIVSNAYVKAITTSATTWYIGDFRKAFAYMQNWPITVVQAPSNSEAEFTQDVVMRFKASEKGVPAIINPQYVVKVTA